MRRFIEERMASGPDAPPLETRLSRYRNMRLDLGMLTFRSIRRSPEGEGWAVRVSTSSGDPATLTFIIEDQSPFRIRGMMVMVGE
jgi:hypothetical protein